MDSSNYSLLVSLEARTNYCLLQEKISKNNHYHLKHQSPQEPPQLKMSSEQLPSQALQSQLPSQVLQSQLFPQGPCQLPSQALQSQLRMFPQGPCQLKMASRKPLVPSQLSISELHMSQEPMFSKGPSIPFPFNMSQVNMSQVNMSQVIMSQVNMSQVNMSQEPPRQKMFSKGPSIPSPFNMPQLGQQHYPSLPSPHLMPKPTTALLNGNLWYWIQILQKENVKLKNENANLSSFIMLNMTGAKSMSPQTLCLEESESSRAKSMSPQTLCLEESSRAKSMSPQTLCLEDEDYPMSPQDHSPGVSVTNSQTN